jgi:glycosyltransferase involved in cell wall biosynthesis
MISVITPTYNTPAQILARTWASLKRQTHTDWQWVVWDDSTDDRVWRQLYGFAADERFYVEAHRSMTPTGGRIGLIKHRLGMIASGDIIVELDHDDELTPDALETLATVFEDPEVGFGYSDWCEIDQAGTWCRYPQGWAYGYGGDYELAPGQWVMAAPEINQTTLRHIVSMPNHVRAWRADVYRQLGGHRVDLPVADDYDLCVRTALSTVCVHVPQLLYKQHIAPVTAQRTRNALIQRLVAELSAEYSADIDRYDGSLFRSYARR